MQNIKFRGQQINTEQWVYGFLYREKGVYLICENIRYAEAEPILMDTVGQFIGLTDINKKEIFTGDIVEITIHNFLFNNTTIKRCVVEFKDGIFGVKLGKHENLTPLSQLCNATFEVVRKYMGKIELKIKI